MNQSEIFHERMNRILNGAHGLARLLLFLFVWAALTLAIGGTAAVFAVSEVKPFMLPVAGVVVYVYLSRFFNRER